MFAAKDTLLTRPSGGYQISRSLRFNSADSAYLNRTPAGAGNRTTWTWSGWIKRSAVGTSQSFFVGNSSFTDANYTEISFLNNNNLYIYGAVTNWRQTTQVFRDVSAWYHIVIVWDTTQATAANRIKLYVNGVEVTSFVVSNNPTLNATSGINAAAVHYISSYNSSAQFYNGYMTEVNFIDGQALTPSSFGETNADTGVWQPKAFAGTYGTNGFYLNFSDNSNTTAATLGKDYSGNGNNWTPNNFSVSAGAGNDSLVDSPTSYGTDTGVGGTVRGNYCTLSPLNTTGGTLSNGNLSYSFANFLASVTMAAPTSGKWYWETTVTSLSGAAGFVLGIYDPNNPNQAVGGNLFGVGVAYYSDGSKYVSGVNTAYGATFGTNDIIGVALNADSGTVTFYKNNTSQGAITLPSSVGGWIFQAQAAGGSNVAVVELNMGQRPFAYTAPSGFKALCTQNLPTPTIGATTATQAGKYFGINLWTGNGSSQTLTNSGGFQPDWVWTKGRSNADSNVLVNAVTGANQFLLSDSTQAEATSAALVSAFTSSGFSIGSSTSINRSSSTYVGWQWKANGAGSSNTSGSITSTVSASTTSGFSVVTWSGNNAASATIGHGLGATPLMIIAKERNFAANWLVYTATTGNTKYLSLNTTAAETTYTPLWNSTTPTSTVFTTAYLQVTGINYIAYCFAPIAGYSAFGSYTGNGSTDGPFVFTGFRPAFVMVKRTDSTSDWYIWDTKRDTYNVVTNTLEANTSDAEASATSIDDLSNGFKCRSATVVNASGGTYIYMAFAEAPQKFSLAR